MKEIHSTCSLNHRQNSYFLYFLFLNCITFNQGDKPHTFITKLPWNDVLTMQILDDLDDTFTCPG